MKARLALVAIGLAGLLGGASLLGCTTPLIQQPEGASGYTLKNGLSTKQFSVAAANPLATQAGYDILKAGGSAVDAAIAVQMVLGLVEPQSSGIGGGAFLLHSSGSQYGRGLQAFDGRETAPALASPDLFISKDGKPMALIDAMVGGRSVGTLGAVRMLEQAHQEHGKLPWARLFQAAIDLASDGFSVSPRMATLLAREEMLKTDPTALAYFYDKAGQPWPAGHKLKNPEYADVLKLLAANGSKALHEGEIAQAVVAKVQSHPSNPGKLSMSDLAGYQPKERTPFCTDYEARLKQYLICGMPPPSSGAIAIAQIFGLLKEVKIGPQAILDKASSSADLNEFLNADWLHHYLESSRLAFADRAQYVADPDFVQPPAGNWTSLVAPDYLASRAKLIGDQSMKAVKAGNPAGAQSAYAPMPHQTEYGTSHISVVDGFGNALAMTTTIEAAWGSRQMVNRGKGLAGGFLLNNQLTDFSFAPTDKEGKPIANRVEGGKRPRSSMSPTLVFDKATGRLVASLGSPGGALIIPFTAKTLYAMLNWNMNTQDAINLPNFASFNDSAILENQRFPKATVEALKARGHPVVETDLTSGLQGIQATASGFFGGADPRREGIVLGD
jgi:gamma-glutamyltranspeptidase / glutathione hydrolase